MSNFNVDFLSRQANPNELGAVVQLQGSLLQQIGQGFVRVQALDEIAAELGALRFKAVDPSGQLRMIMSAINLFEEYGVDAHFAGFDANGVPQIYLSADDGSLVAGGGAVMLNSDGILLPDGGDAIELEDSLMLDHAHLFIDNGQFYIVNYRVSSETNVIANGDFETGSLSSWTETDPSNKISVEAVELGYAAKFNNTNSATEYLQQNVTGSYGFVVAFRAKADQTALISVKNNSGTESKNVAAYINNEWRNYIIIMENTATALTIGIDTTGIAYIDDIVIRAKITGTTTIIKMQGNELSTYGLFYHNKNFKSDADFQIAGVSDNELFYADVSANRIGIGTSTPAEILDVIGNIKASGTIIADTLGGKMFLPFGVYKAIGPFSATSYPYMVTVDRSITFVKWTQAFHVATTNDGSNYWTIRLFQKDGSTIKSINTSAVAADTWAQIASTTFTIASVTTTDQVVGVEVAKTGAPGALSLSGPALEVLV